MVSALAPSEGGPAVRIALTHPWSWPDVQRGGERLFADLGRYLAGAGHDVLCLSSTLGAATRTVDRWGIHERLHVPPRPLPAWPADLRRRQRQQAFTYLPGAAWSLRRWRPDIVHGLYHLDGLAARLAHRRPYLVHIQGMPSRRTLDARPVQRRAFPLSVGKAATVVAVSEAAAAALEEEFGLQAVPLLNGVFTRDFADAAAGVAAEPEPAVLFPGDPADPRKRLPVLVEALRVLRRTWSGLRLLVASPLGASQRDLVAAALDGDFEDGLAGGPGGMARLYGRAWATCLPAVREAFGLVFVESLASGTPAVGVRDGGVPEVLSEDRWLAPPDDPDGLAAAIDRALHAAQEPDVVPRCQALAAPFDWSVRGPAFEDLYRATLGEQRA